MDMSLENKVNDDIKSAMRARDEAGLRALRAIKAGILLARTSEGSSGPMTSEDELRLLQKLVKQRRDSLQIYEQQQRPDLAVKEREEIEVIERYLPGQLSPEALKEAVAAIIAETGAAGPADMGRVMGVATKRLAGQADGKAVSEHVRALLSNKS
jgi:uncharacterized protein YqeY